MIVRIPPKRGGDSKRSTMSKQLMKEQDGGGLYREKEQYGDDGCGDKDKEVGIQSENVWW